MTESSQESGVRVAGEFDRILGLCLEFEDQFVRLLREPNEDQENLYSRDGLCRLLEEGAEHLESLASIFRRKALEIK